MQSPAPSNRASLHSLLFSVAFAAFVGSSSACLDAVDSTQPGQTDGEFDTLPEDDKADAFGIVSQSYEAAAVVTYASTATSTNLSALGIQTRTVRAVVAASRPFASLAAVDAVPYTGAAFFKALLTHVRINNLIGKCGDAVVQTVAGEICDGNLGCSSDCKSTAAIAPFVPTQFEVADVTTLSDNSLAVRTVQNSGTLCWYQRFSAQGAPLTEAFGDGFCPSRGTMAWPGNRVAYIGASETSVVNFDTKTAQRLRGTGRPVFYADDTTVVEAADGVVRFVDKQSGDPIIDVLSASIRGIDRDGAIVIANNTAQKWERLRLDANDVLQRSVLVSSPSAWFSSSYVGANLVLAQQTEPRALHVFAPGNDTATATSSYAAAGAIHVATNGSRLVLSGNDYLVTTTAGKVTAVGRCPGNTANAVRIAETADDIFVATRCNNAWGMLRMAK